MLSRLCRSISRTARSDNQSFEPQDLQARNLSTIADDNNYTRERLVRVIRSYFFIAIESRKQRENKVWGREPAIQESVKKLAPFISELEPDTLHLLIVNLGMINVYNPGIWRDIESNFLNNSHRFLPTSQIVAICEAFDSIRRKNSEVWTLLASKVNSEIYNSGQLDGRDACKLLRAFTFAGHEPQDLMLNIINNVRGTFESLVPRDLLSVLESFSIATSKDHELINSAFAKYLDFVSNSPKKNFANLLKIIVRLGNSKNLDEVEAKMRESFNGLWIQNLASILISYVKDEMISDQKRKSFVEFLLKYYEANKSDLKSRVHENVLILYEAKILYATLKYGFAYDKVEAVRIFKELQNFDEENTIVKNIKGYLETELKNNQLI